MKYELPALPYALDALEPFIDARTMEIHHGRHHAAYVSKLNALLEGYESLQAMSLENILADIRFVPEEIREGVRNNGGGHLNHSLYWQVMAPNAGGEPTGELLEAVNSRFGRFDRFRDEFSAAAKTHFGSGWAWLILDPYTRRLEVLTTANQDSPITQGFRPVLTLDLWEHAYYLKYQNRRGDYVDAWWNLVNWPMVGQLYAETLKLAAPVR